MEKLNNLIQKLNTQYGEGFATTKAEGDGSIQVMIMGFDAHYYDEDEELNFSMNVAPSELDEVEGADELIKAIDTDIAHLQKCKEFVEKMKPYIGHAEHTFYWREGDLLIELNITL